jgi:hypothetical protein
MFKEILFRWMPHNEQNVYEKRLVKVMKNFKIEDYHFNWDRTSCFIEFRYQEHSYRLEHSIEKAKRKGIILRNGMDCLMELTQSLEDLSGIINRGTYRFESWIAGMKQSSPEPDTSEFQEEFQIRYKSLGKRNLSDYNEEELMPFANEPSLENTDQNQIIRRRQRNREPLI